jgi:hypothetical protein
MKDVSRPYKTTDIISFFNIHLFVVRWNDNSYQVNSKRNDNIYLWLV